mgnify:CR=1 FL=1
MMMIVIYVSAALLSLSLLTYLIPLIYQNYLSTRRDVRFYVFTYYTFFPISNSHSYKHRQQHYPKHTTWNGHL